MPTYNFRNKETLAVIEVVMKMSELDDFKKDHPELELFLSAPPDLVSGVGTNIKVDDGFREVLSKVKSTYKVNNIKDY